MENGFCRIPILKGRILKGIPGRKSYQKFGSGAVIPLCGIVVP